MANAASALGSVALAADSANFMSSLEYNPESTPESDHPPTPSATPAMQPVVRRCNTSERCCVPDCLLQISLKTNLRGLNAILGIHAPVAAVGFKHSNYVSETAADSECCSGPPWSLPFGMPFPFHDCLGALKMNKQCAAIWWCTSYCNTALLYGPFELTVS